MLPHITSSMKPPVPLPAWRMCRNEKQALFSCPPSCKIPKPFTCWGRGVWSGHGLSSLFLRRAYERTRGGWMWWDGWEGHVQRH